MKSTVYGIYVTEQPAITLPAERVITKPVLYAASAIKANATGTGNYIAYLAIAMTTAIASSWTGIINQSAYLKGTLAGQSFTVAATDWMGSNETVIDNSLPTSDNIEIRYGNGEEYAVMSIAEKGTELTQVAVADNGWIAVVAGDKVGWVKK